MDEIEEAMEKYKGLVPLVYDIERQELDEAKPNEYKYAVYLKHEADIVIRHHKYKRCLAMAKWCDSENYTACWYHENSERCKWTEKWQERWLELAEKFKEAK